MAGRKPTKNREQNENREEGGGRLSLHPLSLDEALRGAAATGPAPEGPKRERRKPTAGSLGGDEKRETGRRASTPSLPRKRERM